MVSGRAVTLAEVLDKLRLGKSVLLKFHLNFGLYTRHELSMKHGKIVDHSYVDDSISSSTIAAYTMGFYGEAFSKNAVQLLKETKG